MTKKTSLGMKILTKKPILSYALNTRMFMRKGSKFSIAMAEELIDSYYLTMDFASIITSITPYLSEFGLILIGKRSN